MAWIQIVLFDCPQIVLSAYRLTTYSIVMCENVSENKYLSALISTNLICFHHVYMCVIVHSVMHVLYVCLICDIITAFPEWMHQNRGKHTFCYAIIPPIFQKDFTETSLLGFRNSDSEVTYTSVAKGKGMGGCVWRILHVINCLQYWSGSLC